MSSLPKMLEYRMLKMEETMINPYLIIAALASLLISLSGGFYAGYDWSETKAEAKRGKDQAAHKLMLDKLRTDADDLSKKLAQAEGEITTQTIEVIKYVPTVTTGTTLCFGPAAISLLQPGSHQGLRAPASAPPAENAPALAASDRDVAYWIADANQQYDTCSARLTALVDFESATNPEL